jgi:hypothetical protein
MHLASRNCVNIVLNNLIITVSLKNAQCAVPVILMQKDKRVKWARRVFLYVWFCVYWCILYRTLE